MEAGALLTKLMERTGLQERHIQMLRRLEPLMAPMATEIALAFYDYLGRDDEMRAILWDSPGRVERLYQSFADWYRGLFCGLYDDEYAEKRARIGLVHAAIGVKPSFIVPAFGIVQELSLEHLRNTLRSPEIFSAVEAFEKIMAIEAAIMQDSYMQAMEYGYRLGVAADQEKALVAGARAMLGKAN
ncbi:MAG: protoglobin domain-containing protein [Meiothermus sp.]|uniref:protoglobin domain-containing protein n=1 Tax=Meiothermus sp. TaxID=1955249 RepID=UPI0025EDD094|nr:protoglobin domain-containing protein [Meiothermus sp.]MCS7067098.1 protoglobin domain-containing protein [Meiothermus sp.]MDW8424650.1 protoglobin domain-containing protein [Meiothermus sp.]